MAIGFEAGPGARGPNRPGLRHRHGLLGRIPAAKPATPPNWRPTYATQIASWSTLVGSVASCERRGHGAPCERPTDGICNSFEITTIAAPASAIAAYSFSPEHGGVSANKISRGIRPPIPVNIPSKVEPEELACLVIVSWSDALGDCDRER